jgi:hypothetical protein
MTHHFRKVFAKPAEAVPLPLPNPIPATLFGKPEVMPSWFDALMAPRDPSELVTLSIPNWYHLQVKMKYPRAYGR